MPSVVKKLEDKGLIRPPTFLADNVHFEVIMGSVAYGVSSDTSDMDIYGWCVPPKSMVFPHLAGEIFGFGTQKKRFEQFQQHHIDCPDEMGGKGRNYDLQIYSIIKYFQLVMGGNPNMVDSLYVPQDCILHTTQIGTMVRDRRKIFLSKKVWHTFRGYAFAQMGKIKTKSHVGLDEVRAWEKEHGISHEMKLTDVQAEVEFRALGGHRTGGSELRVLTGEELAEYHSLYQQMVEGSKRAERVKTQKFDTKFAYHLVRLLDEVGQIMSTGDVDLRLNREHLKAIRRGEVTEDDIMKWATEKERELEVLYNRESSPIPYTPDEDAIKQLLLECLEHHYGSLDKCIINPDAATVALRQIQEVLDRNQGLLNS